MPAESREIVEQYLALPVVRNRIRRVEVAQHVRKAICRGASPTQAVRSAADVYGLSESTVWGIYRKYQPKVLSLEEKIDAAMVRRLSV